MIPLLAYRGVFRIEDSRRFLVQGVLPAWVFLLGTIGALYYRRKQYLLFASPAWYYIAFYAVLTHFIPRYSLPLLPVMIVCWFWSVDAFGKRIGGSNTGVAKLINPRFDSRNRIDQRYRKPLEEFVPQGAKGTEVSKWRDSRKQFDPKLLKYHHRTWRTPL